MRRTRLGVAAIVVCLAISAGVDPALAGSSGNPQWSVEGVTLKSGETVEIKSEASGAQRLKAGEITVNCGSLSLESGSVITGGSGATPGSGSETLVYSSCQVETGSSEELVPGCKVNSTGASAGTVKTERLAVKLAYATPTAAEHEEPNTVTDLKPESGSYYAQLELSGEGCPFPGAGKYEVEGEVILKNPEASSEKTKHAAEAPAPAVKYFYLNSGGSPKEEKLKSLKVVGVATGVYVGDATAQIKSGGAWAVVH